MEQRLNVAVYWQIRGGPEGQPGSPHQRNAASTVAAVDRREDAGRVHRVLPVQRPGQPVRRLHHCRRVRTRW